MSIFDWQPTNTFVDEEGDRWLRIGEAAKMLKCSVAALQKWADKRCPYRENQETLTTRKRTVCAKEVHFYSEQELKEIDKAWKSAGRYEDEKGVWLRMDKAAKKLGKSHPTMHRYADQGCPYKDGGKLSICKRKVRGHLTFYFLEEELTAVKDAMRSRITQKRKVKDYVDKDGCRWLPLDKAKQFLNRKCVPKNVTTLKQTVHGFRKTFFLESDLKAIKQAGDSRIKEWDKHDEYVDRKGKRWLRIGAAAETYGIVKVSLHNWNVEGCPYLNGKRLSARTRKVFGVRSRFFSEEDLDNINSKRASVLSKPSSNDCYTLQETSDKTGLSKQTLYLNDKCKKHGLEKEKYAVWDKKVKGIVWKLGFTKKSVDAFLLGQNQTIKSATGHSMPAADSNGIAGQHDLPRPDYGNVGLSRMEPEFRKDLKDLQKEAYKEAIAETSPNGQTDKNPDKPRKNLTLPRKAEVLRLAAAIKSPKNQGKSKSLIAEELTEGDKKKAESLLRALRRYPDLLD